jgi:DNA-directed RNA polymerase specialized sigma24 family protein
MARDRRKEKSPLDEVPELQSPASEPGTDPEHRVECLRRCLGQLSAENRDLILNYYQGEKGETINNRKRLMQMFGIPASTLRMRALRVRDRLQLCAENCLQGQGVNPL